MNENEKKEGMFLLHKSLLQYYKLNPTVIEEMIADVSNYLLSIGNVNLFAYNDQDMCFNISVEADEHPQVIKGTIMNTLFNILSKYIQSADFANSGGLELKSLLDKLLTPHQNESVFEVLYGYLCYCVSVMDITPYKPTMDSKNYNFKILLA